MKEKTEFFITFEGGEGGGKSTQSGLLARALQARGYRVVLTREPGGSRLGRGLRRLLLRPGPPIGPWAELFLYEADRAQHVAECILPALRSGAVVICDRFADATLVYQGAGRGLPLQALGLLNQWATGGVSPQLTFILDAPVKEGLARARGRGVTDRIEREKESFHDRVRRGYRRLARLEPQRCVLIPWKDGVQRVHQHILDTTLLRLEKS